MKIEREGAHNPPTYVVTDFDPIHDAEALADALSGFDDERFRIEDFAMRFALTVPHSEEHRPGGLQVAVTDVLLRKDDKYGFIMALRTVALLARARAEMKNAGDKVRTMFAECGEIAAQSAAHSFPPFSAAREAAMQAFWSEKRWESEDGE
jgi:hypothetical protein